MSTAFSPILYLLAFFALTAVNHTSQPGFHLDRDTTTVLAPKSGKKLYAQACASCHGADGRGAFQSQLGFATPVPDFSDCNFATREPDADWLAVAHQGGPVRGFAKDMPAFGKALSEEELQKIMDHIRTLCTDDNWPRGELNLPRALVTEKAYPEDEAVVSTSVDIENSENISNELVFERRFGSRNQLEIVVPFGFRKAPTGNWNGGQLGDVAVGFKRAFYHNYQNGSIVSVTGELIFPTGDQATGFGKGTTILEPFVSYGQILPANSFFQFQGGMEIPFIQNKAGNEIFLRGVLGGSITQGQWGRTWSPMIEVLAARELESSAATQWDLVPQMQVTLNKRQHIRMNIGVRIPAEDPSRDTHLAVYILWDWFDGGLFEGW